MKEVRKDVIEKLLIGYKKVKAKEPARLTYSYETARAKHYVYDDGLVYHFNTLGYDGTRYHSEIKKEGK